MVDIKLAKASVPGTRPGIDGVVEVLPDEEVVVVVEVVVEAV